MLFGSAIFIAFVFIKRKSIFIPFFSVFKFLCAHIRCKRFAVIEAIEKSPNKTDCATSFVPTFAAPTAAPNVHPSAPPSVP